LHTSVGGPLSIVRVVVVVVVVARCLLQARGAAR